MHALAPGITVNGVHISPEQIRTEIQYHPASSLPNAKYEAMQALVIRELLMQEAISKGISTREQMRHSSDEAIEHLLRHEICVPTPTEAECRRYYESNKTKFCTSPIFDVSHIRLGQISKGQTMLAFEAALMKMKAGDISREPVATEVGYHIIRVHRRVEGHQLPFDAVSEWIANTLADQVWRRAFHQYVQILAGKSKISGFRLKSSHSPLIQ
jgi:peptidyl-prolyl cis-trans isomerase C